MFTAFIPTLPCYYKEMKIYHTRIGVLLTRLVAYIPNGSVEIPMDSAPYDVEKYSRRTALKELHMQNRLGVQDLATPTREEVTAVVLYGIVHTKFIF